MRKAQGVLLWLVLIAGAGARVDAATYQVGPTRTYTTIQAVAALLSPGDIVEVDGNATYAGDLTFRRPGSASQPITIRGVNVNGQRPIVSGGTNTVHFRTDEIGSGADHYVFENFEVAGGSFRCIYHQADDLTLRDVLVHHCPAHGILGADWGSGSMLMERCEVHHCGNGDSQHQVYMATDEDNYPGAVFRMLDSYIHDGTGGNNVKSRSARNEIYYNRIEGAYYHELELIGAECCDEDVVREDGDVVGNVLIKRAPAAPTNPDHFVVRVGGDGTAQSWGRYRFVNNTIVAGGAAVFRLFDGLESIEMHNNVFYRLSGQTVNIMRTVDATWRNGVQIAGQNNWYPTGATNVPTQWTGSLTGTSPGFQDVGAWDLRPLAGSPLVNAGASSVSEPPGYPFPNPLFPPAYMPLALPGGALTPQARPVNGQIDIGAFEAGLASPAAPHRIRVRR